MPEKCVLFKCGKFSHIVLVHRDKLNPDSCEKLPKKDHASPSMKNIVKSSKGTTPMHKMMHEDAVMPEESTDEEFHELNCITIKHNCVEPYVANFQLNGEQFPFKIDAGSASSTLKYDDFKRLNCNLESCKIKLQGYIQMLNQSIWESQNFKFSV